MVGLLSIVMPPSQAAQLMVIPALATNIWQMAAGPALNVLVSSLVDVPRASAKRLFLTPTRAGAWVMVGK